MWVAGEAQQQGTHGELRSGARSGAPLVLRFEHPMGVQGSDGGGDTQEPAAQGGGQRGARREEEQQHGRGEGGAESGEPGAEEAEDVGRERGLAGGHLDGRGGDEEKRHGQEKAEELQRGQSVAWLPVLAGEDNDGGGGGEHAVEKGEGARLLVLDAEEIAHDQHQEGGEEDLAAGDGW